MSKAIAKKRGSDPASKQWRGTAPRAAAGFGTSATVTRLLSPQQMVGRDLKAY